nr:precorrin-3B C(17)-methyltransferase [Pseudoruegeria sp. HB172150]
MALSRSGAPVARKVADALDASLHGREGRVDEADVFFPNALDHARDLFASGTPVIGVCASGILIRAVAPLLSDKQGEPPVISVSDDGAVVVPLLGGHRGANRLAKQIAEALSGTAAVTTAGDVALGVALDAPPAGFRLENPEDAREVMAGLLAGDSYGLAGGFEWMTPLVAAPNVTTGAFPAVMRGPSMAVLFRLEGGKPDLRAPFLTYHRQDHALGVGCARNCPPDELWRLVSAALVEAEVPEQSVASVNTIVLKADEPAILALAARLDVPLRFFEAETLEAEAPRLANPSEVVFSEVGCHGVAEGAALAAAGAESLLAMEKRKSANATCAVARAPNAITAFTGRRRGRLSLVGIGPGQATWRTPEASRLIAEANELVGYGLYIDLLGPLAAGKPRHDFPLGGEEDRCRFALERAGEGRDVSLICSGDAGIYAMGALVFELLDRESHGVSDAARRVEVISAPGVSALQAAAARAGAPLGHDFCAISLSDLLTPREDILRRIRAAAEGDFVIAFYNPVSKRRRDLLALARDILLRHRPGDCPVLLASSLGRPEEELRYRRLEELQVDEVDMLTVVLVGSSQSRLWASSEGPRMYTPRGYARKIDGDLSDAG